MPAVSASLFSSAFRVQDILQEQGGIVSVSVRLHQKGLNGLDLEVYVQVAQLSILTN